MTEIKHVVRTFNTNPDKKISETVLRTTKNVREWRKQLGETWSQAGKIWGGPKKNVSSKAHL